ncbi:MAG: ATP-dependent Clp protease proteolytic subunit [Candidatus Bathyarchaeia archaeon]|jgi:ATP-dependent Clp endopeptidase proteolytic subunit ClpP
MPAKLPIVIRFIANVNKATIEKLLKTIDEKMKIGNLDFIILISSPGGNVYYGLTAYNYLKGIPATIITHNIGLVDSIGGIIFCSGSKRLCVPQSRFLIHGISSGLNGNYTERQIEETLKTLKNDKENIAKVYVANTNKTLEDILLAMDTDIALTPGEAIKWNLINEIKNELYPVGSEIIEIND